MESKTITTYYDYPFFSFLMANLKDKSCHTVGFWGMTPVSSWLGKYCFLIGLLIPEGSKKLWAMQGEPGYMLLLFIQPQPRNLRQHKPRQQEFWCPDKKLAMDMCRLRWFLRSLGSRSQGRGPLGWWGACLGRAALGYSYSTVKKRVGSFVHLSLGKHPVLPSLAMSRKWSLDLIFYFRVSA